MKKIILILGILSILVLVGCNQQREEKKDRLYVTLSYSEGQHPTNCTRDDFYGSFVDTQNWMYKLSGGERPERTVYVDLNINQWECQLRDNQGVWCDCHIKSNVDTTNVFDGR